MAIAAPANAMAMHCHFSSSPISFSSPSRHFLPPPPHPGAFKFKPLLLLVLCPNLKLPLLPTPPLSLSSHPVNSELEDDDEEDDDDDDDDDDEFDEYGDDEIAADEYAVVASDEEEDEDEEDIIAPDSMGPLRQSEADKAQRVKKLIADARELGADILDYQDLAGIYHFPIDRFQRLAIQAFLRGSSVVVSAPTSSGKTLIAEASALATLARARRLFYTTPLKALSNQKLRDFRRTFGDHNVGLLTGDSSVNIDAPILIMTTEILRNMLYQSVGATSSDGRLFHVDAIVLDEVHYLSDISRGTVWEEIVIYCPKEVQLICLSATVANPDELAGWIGQIHGTTELVTSSKRPVPLTWHFSRRNGILPLLDERGTKMNRKLSREYLQLSSSRNESHEQRGKRRYRSGKSDQRYNGSGSITRQAPVTKNDINLLRRTHVPQIRDTLSQLQSKDMLPAIWFIFSRRGCDASVQYLEQCMLLDECEASEVELELRRFKSQYPDAVRELAVKGLLCGVAAHHAGCLPLWKSFIEELFQRGLVKVVFATETLAAGINMPARTAVISSLSKRAGAGRSMLTPNELLQMAGRAGRRGIDKAGHVVLLQTPYEGPEECCEILFAGIEPLVSQFTASYGMVLNLLAGSKLTNKVKELEGTEPSRSGRTLEEARKLVEQSFGNYVGSNVIVAAKEELKKIKRDIELYSLEITDEAVDRKCQEQLTEEEYAEIYVLKEDLRREKKLRNELRKQMELKRMMAWKPLLEECQDGDLPFMCLQYKDKDSVQHVVPAVFVGKLSSFSSPSMMSMVSREKQALNIKETEPSYYVALSSDNSWYIFTEKWIKMVYKTGLSGACPVEGGPLPRETLKQHLLKEEMKWEKLADSEFGPLFCMEGSLDTWSWTLNVPVLSSLSEDDEVQHLSREYQVAVENFKEQRRKVSRLKKMVKGTKGFAEFKKIVDARNFTIDKIGRLEARARRLTRRISQIEPTGWKEFLQISKVIQETRAMDINTQVIYPLGETAAALRGENELWIAMVLRNKVLLNLKPAQLAAVCGSLVSEGIKLRPWKSVSYVYEPSSTVLEVINYLEEQRNSLIQIQERYGIKIPCELDSQFSGMVEAWAVGLSWREIMMDCSMDDGDLARLLRRTIDLLAQIPKLPDIDPTLQRNALLASDVMDRSPISELVG
ncbi:hypothetical protein LUZ63_004593 [Rhynchospora breviuscula]|uniref:DExH-box ATP-dependent RNA helicase DExH15 chloroplastic n=1 Tax=Rhynchospora breviuscula TaxID=2022672 RepID=A0A9Q0CLC9_9POAL|nr:hypothetical protein LUZ63_004593 [Rhynchospora breviuscula]